MHNAPTVVYPVGRCVFHAGLLALIGALTAAVGAVYLLGSPLQSHRLGDGMVVLIGMSSWTGWVVVAATSWLRSPVGALKWDALTAQERGGAGTWSWQGPKDKDAEVLSRVECVLDLQGRVLLRCCSANARVRWVWLEQSRDTARWKALRRALVSSRA